MDDLERFTWILNQPTNLKMLMANVDFPLPVRRSQTLELCTDRNK